MITVTVAVLTYNPDKTKLLASLRSVLVQKNVSYEIVIADDGSKTKCFDAVRRFFSQHSFSNYRIIENSENRGTVYNACSAVEASVGEYVKFLSPGDFLNGEDVLSGWIHKMKKSNALLSFSDAVYYSPTTDGPRLIVADAHPRQVSCYLDGNLRQIRYRYLICDDLFLGAATVCHRNTLLAYLKEICGKVFFAEDNVYRLMAYDRIPVCYFPETAVIYEMGLGVSTSANSVWTERLRNDWDACSALLLDRCSGKDPIDKKLIPLLTHKPSGFIGKLLLHLQLPGLLLWKLRKKSSHRMSGDLLPVDFLHSILSEE